MNVYRRLKSLLNKRQKGTFIILVFFIFIGALLETLGVSIIIPLISAVVLPDTIMNNEYVVMALGLIGQSNMTSDTFVKLLLVATMIIFATKNGYMLLLSYFQPPSSPQ